MQKIPTLFKRDYEGTRLVYNELVEGTEWVAVGEGVATEKIDGTACMIRDGKLYKRYELKKGRTPPSGFEPAQEADPITGEQPGWLPVGDGPEDRWHREALEWSKEWKWVVGDGTYELIGPKVQGDKYGLSHHFLVWHGSNVLTDVPRDFEGLKRYFEVYPRCEGVVWHHSDGRMVKIKRRDFGLKW